MNIQAEKIELVKLLLETEDTTLLNEIRTLFTIRENEFWDELPEHVQDGIRKGKEQARSGQTTFHEEVMHKYSKYL